MVCFRGRELSRELNGLKYRNVASKLAGMLRRLNERRFI